MCPRDRRVGPLNRDTVPEPVDVDRSRQIAALIYTSGTTGNPKGVMLTHRNLLFSARVTSALRDPTDKAYCVLPISHIVGYSAILIASLMVERSQPTKHGDVGLLPLCMLARSIGHLDRIEDAASTAVLTYEIDLTS